MVEGEGVVERGSGCGHCWSCPFMGAGHHLGAVAAGCGRPWLGGGLFLGGGGHFHGQSMLSWSNNVPHCQACVCWACDVACHVVVVMVGGGWEWLVMIVGGGGCW